MENNEYSQAMTNDDKYKIMLSHIHKTLLKSWGFKKIGPNFRLITERDGLHYGYLIGFQ